MEGLIAVENRIRNYIIVHLLIGLFLFLYLILVIGTFSFMLNRKYRIIDIIPWFISFITNVGIIFLIKIINKKQKKYFFIQITIFILTGFLFTSIIIWLYNFHSLLFLIRNKDIFFLLYRELFYILLQVIFGNWLIPVCYILVCSINTFKEGANIS
jgi:hypothetical protein